MHGPPERLPGRPATHTRALTVGSLAWQVERLHVGESLLKPSATETLRRMCLRAIAEVSGRQPLRQYKLDLWLALHHTGTGESTRLYKIQRIR
jgi:hypothetical protein